MRVPSCQPFSYDWRARVFYISLVFSKACRVFWASLFVKYIYESDGMERTHNL